MTGPKPAVQDSQNAEVIARVNRLELRVDDLDQLFPIFGQASDPASIEEDHGALREWVASFFATTFTRPLGGEHRWCAQWTEHPEAVFRLRALRRAFFALQEETRMGDAVWLREHLDPQLNVLISARGPFALCSLDRHDHLPPLPTEAKPEERTRALQVDKGSAD